MHKIMGWRRTLAVLTTIGLALALAAPAAASSTRQTFTCDEWLEPGLTVPGSAVVEDGVLLLRGWTYTYTVVGDDLCAGVLTVEVNFNLDLSDWSGALFGKASVALAAFDGGFRGTFNAHWTTDDPLDYDAEDIWAGRYVRHGYGELDGWQARGALLEKHHWLITESGSAFQPGK